MLDKLLLSDQKEIQMIVFNLGNEEYAVPITNVQEIIMRQSPTRIPKSPSFVEGVINLRGHIIPIIDGKRKFMLESVSNQNANEERIMILELEEESIGLIVDAVSEVIHLNISDIEPPPIEMDSETEFLWGVGKFQGRLLILLDPQKFMTITEVGDMKKLAKVTNTIKQINEVEQAITETKEKHPKTIKNTFK